MERIQEIYERQAERVFRLCMIYLKNGSDAQDGMQEVFLKLLERDILFEDPHLCGQGGEEIYKSLWQIYHLGACSLRRCSV